MAELLHRAADFQFMNIFPALEREHRRVENELHHIESEKAVTYSASDPLMLYEYEVGHDEQRDRKAVKEYDIPSYQPGIQ